MRLSYRDMYDRQRRLQPKGQVFTTQDVVDLLGLEQISQARCYINWMLSCDRARLVRDDGVQCYYDWPPTQEMVVKPWHPESMLPQGYWNGVSPTGVWLDDLGASDAN